MNQTKRRAVRGEARKFTLTGLTATAVDYILLNIGVLVFHLPLLTANVFSTSLASVVSFWLNRNVVFDGQRHGHARTIVRFIIINAIGIFVIQTTILFLIGHTFDGIANTIVVWANGLGIQHINNIFVSVNLAKGCASAVAAVWNFIMLRRFVFIPTDAKDK